MKSWVSEYLEDHKSSWAETTMRSEIARLNSLTNLLHLAPEKLHEALTAQGKKPYTIKTTFLRLVAFEAWCFENKKIKGLKFKLYMKKHRNRFKHAYQKEEIQMTFEDAKVRIDQMAEPYRSMALGLLKTGLRISEAYKVEDGQVVGKGGKPRRVYAKIETVAPRSTFYLQLKAVGLKPHTLRKLCATNLSDKGASAADLCKVFGWSSIATSYQYLIAKDDVRLQALMEESKEG